MPKPQKTYLIFSLLELRREDVDLEAGTAISRAQYNKGRRDVSMPLHPVVVDHLRRLVSFEPVIFPWYRCDRAVFSEFRKLNEAVGIKLVGPKSCYGFHDIRRAFATMNAGKLSPNVLQTLMQHKDYQTTQRYINQARQIAPAVAELYVPRVPQRQTAN